MGSSRTRARARVPCIGRRILNHCATREVPDDHLLKGALLKAAAAEALGEANVWAGTLQDEDVGPAGGRFWGSGTGLCMCMEARNTSLRAGLGPS